MRTQLGKYDGAYRDLRTRNAKLAKQVNDSKESIRERLETAEKLKELDELRQIVDAIPPEIISEIQRRNSQSRQIDRGKPREDCL